jgi:hypothetical protein
MNVFIGALFLCAMICLFAVEFVEGVQWLIKKWKDRKKIFCHHVSPSGFAQKAVRPGVWFQCVKCNKIVNGSYGKKHR